MSESKILTRDDWDDHFRAKGDTTDYGCRYSKANDAACVALPAHDAALRALVEELAANVESLDKLARQVSKLAGSPVPLPDYIPELLARAKEATE